MRRAVCIAVCSMAFAAVGPAWAASPAEAIANANRQFVAAFNSGNAAGVASLYATDAMLLPPGEARVEGRDAIGKYWKGAIDAGLRDFELKAEEVQGSGEYAYEVGTATASMPKEGGGSQPLSVKYVVVWHQSQDGHWNLYRDIWNDNPAGKE